MRGSRFLAKTAFVTSNLAGGRPETAFAEIGSGTLKLAPNGPQLVSFPMLNWHSSRWVPKQPSGFVDAL